MVSFQDTYRHTIVFNRKRHFLFVTTEKILFSGIAVSCWWSRRSPTVRTKGTTKATPTATKKYTTLSSVNPVFTTKFSTEVSATRNFWSTKSNLGRDDTSSGTQFALIKRDRLVQISEIHA